MLEKVAKAMANFIGVFVEYDKNNNTSFWWQYMRLRVKIDVRMPLKKQTKLKNKGCTINFRYEKLSMFYSVCGLLGHSEHIYEVRVAMEEDTGVHEWSIDFIVESERSNSASSSRWLKDDNGGNREKDGGNMEKNDKETRAHTRETCTPSGASEAEFQRERDPHALVIHDSRSVVISHNRGLILNATMKSLKLIAIYLKAQSTTTKL